MREPLSKPAFIHPAAICESDDIGEGTRIWAFAHVMQGAHVGKNCNICDHAFVEEGAWIGDGVTIKNQVMVWKGVRIEDGAFISPGAIFTNDRHPRSPRIADVPEIAQRYAEEANWLSETHVGRGATIGAGAVILPGLSIGPYSMIAAGAVVTSDIAAHELVGGNPARSMGYVGITGIKLRETADGVWACPDTGDKFKMTGDALAKLDS
jgi:acetyltransferase-like isoleucine patch superfamily enzyme